MPAFLEHIVELGTMQCCLIATLGLMGPLERRERFGVRLVLSLGMLLLLTSPIYAYQEATISRLIHHPMASETLQCALLALTSMAHLALFIVSLAGLYLACFIVKLGQALYCSAITYLTQDVAYTLFTLLMPWASHRGTRPLQPQTLPVELGILALTILVFRPIARKLFVGGGRKPEGPLSLALMMATLGISKALGTIMSISYSAHAAGLFRISVLYDLLLSASVTGAQMLIFSTAAMQRRLATERAVAASQRRQFENLIDATDTIKRKSHDLKLLISALEVAGDSASRSKALSSVKLAIATLDMAQNTGCAELDAVLNRAWGQCEAKQIAWTSMAEGAAVAHIDPFDLFVLVGNALDNAIEAVEHIDDPDRRFISFSLKASGSLAFMEIDNYTDSSPVFINGLPQTTKPQRDSHGYGVSNMAEVVARYDGAMECSEHDGVYTLRIMLPIP